jgi:hypothetical protein
VPKSLFLHETFKIMSDIQTRKILFLQDFLRLNSEESIAKLEQLLSQEIKGADIDNPKSLTVEELNRRIDRSEADFAAGNYTESNELRKKFER